MRLASVLGLLLTLSGLGRAHAQEPAAPPAPAAPEGALAAPPTMAPPPAQPLPPPAAQPLPPPAPVEVAPEGGAQGTPSPGEAVPPAAAPSGSPGPVAAPPEVPAATAAPYAGGPRGRHVVMAPPVVRPVEPPRRRGDARAPFAVGIGGAMVWRRDAGYAYFLERERAGEFDVFASYDVLDVSDSFKVSLGPSYHRFAAESGDLALRQHALQLDVMARNRTFSFLSPHVRAAIGWVATRVELGADVVSFDELDHGYIASFGGGVTLHTPERLFESRRGTAASLSFGLLAEGGYTLAPQASFRQKASTHNGIDRSAIDLGGLDRKGPYLRILFVTRF